MKNVLRRVSPVRGIVAAGALLALASGCVGAADDPSTGAASQAATTLHTARVGTAYRYSVNGAGFYWEIYRSPNKAQVAYRNERADGSWAMNGTINRWSRCPAANESVQVINASGYSQLCTHVCLPDGREELHCPSSQIELSRVTEMSTTIDTGAAPRAPAGTRSTCDRRIGCLDYTSCMSCCGSSAMRDDGIIDPIEATGCEIACTFAGGEVGTPACGDPYPPTGEGGMDEVSTCMPMAGYPTWCDYAF